MRKWNKEFDVEDIGGNCFYIVLVDDNCEDNFSDCVNADGQLIYDESHMITAECELAYDVSDTRESIILNADCIFDFAEDDSLPDSFKFKGAFLVTDARYVLGYSINQYSLEITTQMIFEKDLRFFGIVESVSNGE